MADAQAALPHPDDDIWADHRRRTRRAILGSFVAMLGEENPSTISMPAVAARAGVSVRTLYRYFADKDALMAAASAWYDDDARVAVATTEINLEVLPHYLDVLWNTFAENLPAVRAQHTGPVGRDLRRRRLDRARADSLARIPAAVPEHRRADVVDLIIAVTSSSMFLELVDRMGHDPSHAVALATRLTDLVIADAVADGHVEADRPHDPPTGSSSS